MLTRRIMLAGLVAVPTLLAVPLSAGALAAGEIGTDGEPLLAAEGAPSSAILTDSPSSPNGWPVNGSGSAIGIRRQGVPGTSVQLPVPATLAGAVLLRVAERFHREVEPLGEGCWGYAYRANVNSPGSWSNHASGTAIDLNAPRHPNGRANTFRPEQVAAIRGILAGCRGTVRWGGDYSRTKDEMHFEIVARPGDPRLPEALR